MAKRKRNELTDDIADFATGAIGLGIGTAIVGRAGGDTSGLRTVASVGLPLWGGAIALKHGARAVKKLRRGRFY